MLNFKVHNGRGNWILHFFECVCVYYTPSAKKKKLSRYWWKFCECWKMRKKLCFYFCQTRTQEQSFPVLQWIAKIKNPPSPPQCKYNCPSLLSTIVFIYLKLYKKKSSQKVCNRYILSFQTKVGNRSIYDNKVSCFISSFYCFCCVPILYWKSWSFLLVVEHQ